MPVFLRRKNRGQSIVEFAVLFPFFLLIVLGGIIDFGIAFYNLITLQQIAASAARYATEGGGQTGRTDQQIHDYINSKKPSWWKGPFVVPPLSDIPTSDKVTVIKKVFIMYESPMYTPFYITMFRGVSGIPSLKLTVEAAYQVPRNINSGPNQ